MDTSWDREEAKCESLFYRYRTIGESALYNIVNAYNTAELAEQGQARDLCSSRYEGTSDTQGSRPNPETSVGQVQVRDLHRSRPKPASTTGEARASNLCETRSEPATSAEAGPSK